MTRVLLPLALAAVFAAHAGARADNKVAEVLCGGNITPGTPVVKPEPVFTKLDPSVVEEELARLSS